ncbi:hypothetical protein DACRYDRAFT_112477 [Dacryopinax primogenitus]|uniref:Uncharacterized protein n=1 Tax=Dacryopinax primogenitus (strain DJM 731) TaxID=1858805 RepID=M5FN18_DACPD|nr:uncharacterized protein DACRYDRAFT_112477 [Dacryopinax primogenitus]EJT96670.1 hypothetical protein DACRYDRAFT_112477 [Dacryopinax primogenitus]
MLPDTFHGGTPLGGTVNHHLNTFDVGGGNEGDDTVNHHLTTSNVGGRPLVGGTVNHHLISSEAGEAVLKDDTVNHHLISSEAGGGDLTDGTVNHHLTTSNVAGRPLVGSTDNHHLTDIPGEAPFDHVMFDSQVGLISYDTYDPMLLLRLQSFFKGAELVDVVFQLTDLPLSCLEEAFDGFKQHHKDILMPSPRTSPKVASKHGEKMGLAEYHSRLAGAHFVDTVYDAMTALAISWRMCGTVRPKHGALTRIMPLINSAACQSHPDEGALAIVDCFDALKDNVIIELRVYAGEPARLQNARSKIVAFWNEVQPVLSLYDPVDVARLETQVRDMLDQIDQSMVKPVDNIPRAKPQVVTRHMAKAGRPRLEIDAQMLRGMYLYSSKAASAGLLSVSERTIV